MTFSKPNKKVNYIHKESNHLPSIIKHGYHFSIDSWLSIFFSNEKREAQENLWIRLETEIPKNKSKSCIKTTT